MDCFSDSEIAFGGVNRSASGDVFSISELTTAHQIGMVFDKASGNRCYRQNRLAD